MHKVTWFTNATAVAIGLAVLTILSHSPALQAQTENTIRHKPLLLRAETPEFGSPGSNPSRVHSESSHSLLGLRPSPAQVYQLPRLRNLPVATKEHQGINEVSILVSPSPTASEVLYSAYMPYDFLNQSAVRPLIKVAKVELGSSLTVSSPSQPPPTYTPITVVAPAGFTLPVEGSNAPFDSFIGDPVLASNPDAFGFHPRRIWLAGTTSKNGKGVENQITIWHYDPDPTSQTDPQFIPIAGIGHNPACCVQIPDGTSDHFFNDKPAIAVSQFAGSANSHSTKGNVYVAYIRSNQGHFSGDTGYKDSIQFCKVKDADGESNSQDHCDNQTVYTTLNELSFSKEDTKQHNIPMGLRLDVDPTNGAIYLSWLDLKESTIHVMRSRDDTDCLEGISSPLSGRSSEECWRSATSKPIDYDPMVPPSVFPKEGPLLSFNSIAHPSVGSICNGSNTAHCVLAPAFLSSSLSFGAGTLPHRLVFVYHKRLQHSTSAPLGSEVMLQSFNIEDASFSTEVTPSEGPSTGFGEAKRVSDFPSTYNQWRGSVACDTKRTCTVVYYESNPAESGPAGDGPQYRVYARRLQDDGALVPDSIHPGANEGSIPLDTSPSDSSVFIDGNMEYQDIFYRDHIWYTASITTQGHDSASGTSDVVVSAITPCSEVRRRAVNPYHRDPKLISPKIPVVTDQPGHEFTLSVDLDLSAGETASWSSTDPNDHFADGPSINVQPMVTTTYTAVISNGCSSTATTPLTITVTQSGACTPPVLSGVAYGGEILNTESVQFFLVHDAPAPNTSYSYQWYRGSDGQPVGLNSDRLTATTTAFETYYCVVTKTCAGATSMATSSLGYIWQRGSCDFPPLHTSQTSNDTAGSGYVTFMAFDDWPGLTFQWYMGESGDTSHPVQGDYRAPDRLTVYTPAYRPHSYWVRVSLPCGAFKDSGTLTFTKDGCTAILFTPQPQSAEIAAGATATITANTPFAVPPVSAFQWFSLSDIDARERLIGKTDSILSITPPKTTRYLVSAANNCSQSVEPQITETVDSKIATVRVNSCPQITDIVVTQTPSNSWVKQGHSATLVVTSSGATPTYQWYQGEVGDDHDAIANATSSSYPTPALSAPANYWVRLREAGGCTADSNTIHLNVCAPLHANEAGVPFDQVIDPYGSAVLWYPVTGTKVAYQWYIGLPPGSGVPEDLSRPIGNSSDAIRVALVADSTTYWVRATDQCGDHIDSPPIRVGVRPQIRHQPVAALDTVMPGLTTTLTADGGTASASFQWYQVRATDGPLAFGPNSPTVTTPAITADTQFFLRITSGAAYVDTDTVTVHVCAPMSVIWGSGTATNVAYDTHFSLVVFPPPDASEFDFYRGVSGDVENSTLLRRSAVNGFDANPITETTSYWVRVLNANGNCWGDSTTRTVRLCIPAITQSPSSTLINQGATAILSVTATPPANVTYQWYEGEKGDTSKPISGATASTRSVSPTVTTSYWVRVDGGCGVTADSDAATVTVCQQPVIQYTAVNGATGTTGSIAQNQTASCTVTATGMNLTYQWYSGASGNTASPIGGATGAQMTVTPMNTSGYWVRVSGTCGTADSQTLTVVVCATPSITSQPQSVSIFSGGSTTLTVAATEATSSSVAYQWYRGNSGDVTAFVGSGTSFTTPALTSNTSYWVRVSCGICTPADSQTATVSMCAIPSTLPSPGDSYIAIGQTATLSTITGGGNSYAWYVGASGNTSQFAGYTTASMSIAPAVTTSYWCRVQNGSCVTATPAATVYVCIPTITQQPQSIMINPGASTTLSVAANTPGLTYQWYTGASGTTTSPLAGQTGSTLTVTPSSATSYWVRVMGSCNRPTDSATATISICQVPSVTASQTTLSIVRGQTATISVNASGTNLSYQWYIGPAGNTGASYATGSAALAIQVTPQDTTSYWARVTGTCGTRDSSNIVVNVCAPPTITSQPQSVSVMSGTTATLSVASSEATVTPVTYQWYRGNSGDTTVSVGTGTSFTTPAMTSQTSYWVRLSCGVCNPVDSNTATVSICPYPATLSSPGNVNIALGQTATLSTVTGTGNSYAWYVGASGNTSQFAGYTTASMSIAPTVTTSYWCRVTNGTCVSATQTATVNVCVPTFTQQPADITIQSGASTTLTSSANTAGVTYRWYTGAVGNTSSPVTNGTTASITVSPSSTTTYWVRATGSCGVTTDSVAATVTICPAPVITTQPSNTVPVQQGGMPSFGVVASGSNLTYQWYYGESGNTSSPINGATGASYANPIYSTIRIWVRVSSQCGSVNSVAVWGSVYPQIGQQPAEDISVGYNATASTTLAANGTYLHYAWRWGNVPVPGAADSPTLVTPSITSNTYVYCIVSSGIAGVQSNPTNLNVCYEGPYISSITKNATSITVSANGGYGTSYTWYQGTRGDISHPVGSNYNWLSPSVPGTYWCRVYPGYFSSDPTCYSDSDAMAFP